MARLTVRALITEKPPSGLGYCCMWFFFKRFRQTALIAARLGVTDRAVRTAKASAKEGSCAGCPSCLHARFTLEGEPRKISRPAPRSDQR